MKLKPFFIGTLGLALGAPGAGAHPTFPLYERYVGIDNVCAWPQLSKQRDGTLSVLIWPHPVHGSVTGAVEAWRSVDQGRSWEKTGVPVPNDPAMNRMNHAGGVAPDGSYIALVSGWDFRPGGTNKSLGSTLAAVPARSTDSGLTWKQFPAIPAPVDTQIVSPRGKHDKGLVPYGRVHALADGRLGVMLYSTALFFFTSADGGASWQQQGQLSKNSPDPAGRTYNETTWMPLANGELYAAARTNKGREIDGLRSRDQGATWVSEGFITMPNQHPADLISLPDGRVLLTYGVRNQHTYAIQFRIGDAAARNWSAPLTLVDLEGATPTPAAANPPRDGGYPSTVVLDDGTLVTAYYSRGMPSHQRYHMGIVRWRLDAPKK